MIYLFGVTACSCPPEQSLRPSYPINTYGWTAKQIPSNKIPLTHYYAEYPSKMEDAPILLLIHGLVFDEQTFIHFAPLTDYFHLIAWRIPEDAPMYHGDCNDFSQALKDFIIAMNLDSFFLGGFSMGGYVAMKLFPILDSQQIKGLIIMNSYILDCTKRLKRSRERRFSFLSKRSDEFIMCGVKRVIQRAIRDHEDIPAQQNIYSIFRLKPISYWRQAAATMLNYDGESGANTIHCPTLIIHAEEDESIDVKIARYYLKYIPHADFVLLAGVAHSGIFSNSEQYIRIIIRWYSQLEIDARVSSKTQRLRDVPQIISFNQN